MKIETHVITPPTTRAEKADAPAVGAAAMIMIDKFWQIPERIQFQVMMSLLQTFICHSPDPQARWDNIKLVIDKTLPSAIAVTRD